MGLRDVSRSRGDTKFRSLDVGANLRKVAQDNILPRMAFKGMEAVGVDRHRFYYYQKRLAGRRCSCFGVNSSSESMCAICLGRGIVGIYDKFGCETHVLDVTSQDISAVNVSPNYDFADAPVRFYLMDEYETTQGEINFTLRFNKSVIGVDVIQAIYNYVANESLVTIQIKAPADISYVTLTDAAVAERLSAGRFNVRVTLRRGSPEAHLPSFSHIYFRFRTMEESASHIFGDVPVRTETNALQDYGVQQNIDSRSMWMPHQRIYPKTDDLFYDLEDQSLWTVISVTDFRPLQTNQGWNLQLAYIQPTQPVNRLLR